MPHFLQGGCDEKLLRRGVIAFHHYMRSAGCVVLRKGDFNQPRGLIISQGGQDLLLTNRVRNAQVPTCLEAPALSFRGMAVCLNFPLRFTHAAALRDLKA